MPEEYDFTDCVQEYDTVLTMEGQIPLPLLVEILQRETTGHPMVSGALVIRSYYLE